MATNPPTSPPGTIVRTVGITPIPPIPTATDLDGALTAITLIGQAIESLAQAVADLQAKVG